jgi:hypothetical protein
MCELTDMRDATAHRPVSKPVFIVKMIYMVVRMNEEETTRKRGGKPVY